MITLHANNRKTVTLAEAQQWFDHFARRDDLALASVTGYCDCRAHKMSTELVAAGLHTVQAWFIKTHKGNEDMEYTLHVASCLMVKWPDGSTVPMALDPAHAPFPVKLNVIGGMFRARTSVLIDMNDALGGQNPANDFSHLYDELNIPIPFNKDAWDERSTRLLKQARQFEKDHGLEPAPWIQKLRTQAPKPVPPQRPGMTLEP